MLGLYGDSDDTLVPLGELLWGDTLGNSLEVLLRLTKIMHTHRQIGFSVEEEEDPFYNSLVGMIGSASPMFTLNDNRITPVSDFEPPVLSLVRDTPQVEPKTTPLVDYYSKTTSVSSTLSLCTHTLLPRVSGFNGDLSSFKKLGTPTLPMGGEFCHLLCMFLRVSSIQLPSGCLSVRVVYPIPAEVVMESVQ
ncbi:hypothetical protein KIPB_007310 [Kipferlia bialata]|uniref:Uncharacterized protein n=1 Tax=Kipferlia bialata TaxID=797122 RepID=A0A9K3D038_9EUKA|nr:hypothetical protein KIPB_007310 [Kipferlia bialata]|eukprot:g7310.t1